MPYGIDTSWYQRNLDITAVANAGNEFNIVKSVRANEPTLAEADAYRSNIDRTIDSPMIGKGHYAVPNSRNTPKPRSRTFVSWNMTTASSESFGRQVSKSWRTASSPGPGVCLNR